jgi:pimeloyl-ACP methyl ester carboxylesterase
MNTGEIAKLKNLSLWYQTFGLASNPAILLLMGAGSQGILWDDEFCKKLARDFYVIRYDHRDTGESSCHDYNQHPYNLNDLANDALELLSHLNIAKAHFIGLSMGGHLVQLIAAQHPERVLTTTIMMSTPNHMVFMNALQGKMTPSSSLPPPFQNAINFLTTPPNNLKDKKAMIPYSIETWKVLNGPHAPFNEAYWKALVTQHYNRIVDHGAQYNHGLACLASPEDRTELLKKIKTPTLVIHGTDDPALPIEHGRALAKAIPNARFEKIQKMGHALNPIFFDKILSLICKYINKNSGTHL